MWEPAHVPEETVRLEHLADRVTGALQPFVVRGLAADWPLVREGLKGAQAAHDYLLKHQRNCTFFANVGEEGGDDRPFYTADMAMNFRMVEGQLHSFLDAMARSQTDTAAPFVYLSSIDMRHFFKGLAEANGLPLGDRWPLESIWIGNRTCVATHNDVPDNLAVCAVGRRRFTLFPPEQYSNLYLGPLENTPAGRPVSMVDLRNPDLSRYPRFSEALAHAQVAELSPGDALFVPSLWWHHVEATEPFNILVNYWWRDVPAFLGKPEDALLHAILALRDLPQGDKERWRALFDHYVFADGADVNQHLPEPHRGILAPLTAETAGQIRARLLRSLTR